MKCRRVVWVCLAAWIPFAVSGFGQEMAEEVEVTVTNRAGGEGVLEIRAGLGGASYEESVSISPVESEWDGAYGEVGLTYTYSDRSGYKLRLGGSLWASDSDTEEWREQGQLVQRNDLEVSGLTLTGEFGIGLVNRPDRSLNAWLGLGYRYNDFERSDFNTFDQVSIADLGSVSEEYDIGTFSVALDGVTELSPKWSLSGNIGVGIVFFNEASNEVIPGTVEGDGGVIVEVGMHAWYAVAKNRRVGVGVQYEHQELDGGTESRFFITRGGIPIANVVEWPDNELDSFLIDVRWVVDL